MRQVQHSTLAGVQQSRALKRSEYLFLMEISINNNNLEEHHRIPKMPGPPSKAEQDLTVLKSTVSSISALLKQLQSSPAPTKIKPSNDEPPTTNSSTSTTSDNTLDPLALAHDSASLIKAHTTKLSLLIISPPFTPTAITSVLRALSAGPLPGLASSITLCTPSSHTYLLSSELHYRATKIISSLSTLINAIPLDGNVLEKEKKDGGRGSLVGTGAVWDACEEVMKLKTLGLAGVCVQKVESYREIVKDALEELKEWGEEEGDDDEEDNDDDDDNGGSGDEEDGEGKEGDSTQDLVDSIFNTPHHIPSADPDRIRPRLDFTLRRLRLLVLLYTSLVKRRFKTILLTPDPSMIDTIDSAIGILKNIPDIVDDLASAFYDLDPAEIDARMKECFETGKDAAEKMARDWKGREDEFSVWVSAPGFISPFF